MNSIQRLSSLLRQLPGVGPKAADRMAWWLLKQPKAIASELSSALNQLHEGVAICTRCRRYSDHQRITNGMLCEICQNPGRDQSIICVVGESNDTAIIETTHNFSGVYHVLGGYLDPLEGVTASDIAITELLERVRTQTPKIQELILAFNADVRGETTALYIRNALSKERAEGVKLTALARGLPSSALIEYADELTLSDALKGRREV